MGHEITGVLWSRVSWGHEWWITGYTEIEGKGHVTTEKKNKGKEGRC